MWLKFLTYDHIRARENGKRESFYKHDHLGGQACLDIYKGLTFKNIYKSMINEAEKQF